MTNVLSKMSWLESLGEDCRRILARHTVLAAYEMGRRIVEDSDYQRYSREVSQQDIADAIGTNQLAVSEAIRCYERVGDEFNGDPIKFMDETGINTWNKLHLWLPRRTPHAEDRPLLPLPNKKYHTVVIDPPWPLQKIIREVRPNQVAKLDYDRMSIEAIRNFPIQRVLAENGCHVYLWTTHRFLPDAFIILREWGVNYECLLTWVKNVGFTPYSWMYSTEHVLFGRVGDLQVKQKGTRVDFTGKVREHSRKPDEFYDLVCKMSPGPRIDLFSREKHEGFDQYGLEIEKFVTVQN